MAVGDVPLTPIIDTVTGSVTEIGRIFLRTLAAAVNGLAPIDATYWVSKATAILTSEVNLGALAPGYLKLATAVGIATPATVATIPQADVTGLTAALAGKATLPIAQTDVTNLVADLGSKAPLASPGLTGVPTAPTAAAATNTAQLATTAFVAAAVAAGGGAGVTSGTWTPSLGGSATYSIQTGSWVKVGRLVYVSGSIAVSAIGSGSAGIVTGLPFPANPALQVLHVSYFGAVASAMTWLGGFVNGSNLQFTSTSGAVVTVANPANVFTTGTQVNFAAVYSTT